MDLVRDVLAQTKEFFALPLEKKMAVSTELLPDEFNGYHALHSYNRSGLTYRDSHEAFNFPNDPAKAPDFPDPSLQPLGGIWPTDMPKN